MVKNLPRGWLQQKKLTTIRGWTLRSEVAPFRYWPLALEFPILFSLKDQAERQNAEMGMDFKIVEVEIEIKVRKPRKLSKVAQGNLRFHLNIACEDVDRLLIEQKRHLTPEELDRHTDNDGSLAIWLGRKVDLHFGCTGVLVRHATRKFAVRFRFGPCQKCGKKSKPLYAVSGLHAGAWCYVYDATGIFQANMRDDIYKCDCGKVDAKSGRLK